MLKGLIMRIGWICMARGILQSNFKANSLQGHCRGCSGWCGSDRFWLCSSIRDESMQER